MTRIPQMPVVRRTAKGRQSPPPTPPRPDAVSGLAIDIDIQGLERRLRRDVTGEVRFTAGDRALYSTDASNYRQIPVGVVLPKGVDDVIATVAACREFGAPIVSRGGATDLAGATCNAAVVMDMSKYMNRVLEINWEEKWARVQPGTVLDDLRNTAEQRHLTFGPDPATHERNTLGGMIGNNSCGMHAQMAGKVEENTISLDVLTYDGERMTVGPTSETELQSIIGAGGVRGEIYSRLAAIRDRYADQIRAKFPKIPRLVSGYPLHQLLPEHGFNVAKALVGTESTCVTVLEAKLRLVHSPPVRSLVVVGYKDIFTAGDHVAFCNEFKPIALEGIDCTMFDYMHDKGMSTDGRKLFPDGGAWLVVEFGGDTKEETAEKAQRFLTALKAHENPPAKLYEDAKQEHLIWKIRESGLGSTSKIPHDPDFYPGWEDSAVGPADIGNYLRGLQKLLDKYGYTASLYGHFGQGCVHCSIDFDLFTAEGIERWKKFLHEAAHLVTSFGGSLSGEHGDGQSRGSLLPIMFGDELVQAFREFKSAWDPRGKMNPGKVVDAYPVDVNLRWGPHYKPWEPETHFAFKDDRGSFAYAANRCVGTGACRKHDKGTMCPSYMVTREEKHSTRGRSRLLFEMLEGNPLSDGWHDETVKDALDLCLACKACRGECPVNVDMATYKAEFLSHYYDGRRRPLSAYAFGLMHRWARLAAHMPRAANLFTQAPGLRSIAKRVLNVAPERRIPAFAHYTFRDWFTRRRPSPPSVTSSRPKVLLWPDTWNNYFLPETTQAATSVLEAAGYEVMIPSRILCCGRPLYDYGMLDTAKKLLEQTLDTLRPHLRAGVPIIGLEPSCISVFRDELPNLITDDDDARLLREQSFQLGEFLADHAPQFSPPKLARKAVIHGHCHGKSVLKFDQQQQLFDALGLDCDVLDSGCCGMAGAFGYEKGEHYRVSIACGERVLLPAVRKAAPETLLVADGFSCREQIEQTTGRHALHLAEVLKMALDQEKT